MDGRMGALLITHSPIHIHPSSQVGPIDGSLTIRLNDLCLGGRVDGRGSEDHLRPNHETR